MKSQKIQVDFDKTLFKPIFCKIIPKILCKIYRIDGVKSNYLLHRVNTQRVWVWHTTKPNRG